MSVDVLMFLLLPLNIFHTLFKSFYCSLWTSKCRLGLWLIGVYIAFVLQRASILFTSSLGKKNRILVLFLLVVAKLNSSKILVIKFRIVSYVYIASLYCFFYCKFKFLIKFFLRGLNMLDNCMISCFWNVLNTLF